LAVGALSRLSTGGGFETRQLYTDSDEALFNASRPIIFSRLVTTEAGFVLRLVGRFAFSKVSESPAAYCGVLF
jgi:hypothetical protein